MSIFFHISLILLTNAFALSQLQCISCFITALCRTATVIHIIVHELPLSIKSGVKLSHWL